MSAIGERLIRRDGSTERQMPGSEAKAVVIVEDDPSMCQALARILRLGGFSCVVYGSAEEALAANGLARAVCLIVDVQLPGMTGFALHRHLAAKGPPPPVVFITAFDEVEARATAARIDGAQFLAKPFPGRALLATIERMAGGGARISPP
jgi:FixJ family two-component response regulator